MTEPEQVARFSQLEPSIRQSIASASPDARRRIAVAVAEAALAGQSAHPSELDDALTLLKSGRWSPTDRASIVELADRLDVYYLDLYDDEKPGGRTDGWQPAFQLARAAAAVSFAFDDDPTVAAVEASYEAWHALDGDPALCEVVEEIA